MSVKEKVEGNPLQVGNNYQDALGRTISHSILIPSTFVSNVDASDSRYKSSQFCGKIFQFCTGTVFSVVLKVVFVRYRF